MFAVVDVPDANIGHVKEAVSGLACQSILEAGCLRYVVCQSRKHPVRRIIQELRADGAAIKRHRGLSHVKAFKAALTRTAAQIWASQCETPDWPRRTFTRPVPDSIRCTGKQNWSWSRNPARIGRSFGQGFCRGRALVPATARVAAAVPCPGSLAWAPRGRAGSPDVSHIAPALAALIMPLASVVIRPVATALRKARVCTPRRAAQACRDSPILRHSQSSQ